MSPIDWIRIAVISAVPFLLSLYLSLPAFQPSPLQVTGNVTSQRVCFIACADVAAIGPLHLACKLTFSGIPSGCDRKLLAPGEVTATYARPHTAANLLGLSPTHGVLLKLQRGDETVFQSSLSRQAWGSLYGDWLFHAVYWPLAILMSFFSRKRKPAK